MQVLHATNATYVTSGAANGLCRWVMLVALLFDTQSESCVHQPRDLVVAHTMLKLQRQHAHQEVCRVGSIAAWAHLQRIQPSCNHSDKRQGPHVVSSVSCRFLFCFEEQCLHTPRALSTAGSLAALRSTVPVHHEVWQVQLSLALNSITQNTPGFRQSQPPLAPLLLLGACAPAAACIQGKGRAMYVRAMKLLQPHHNLLISARG